MVKELIKDPEILGERTKEWDVRGNQDLAIELVQSLDDTLEANPDLLFLTANELGYSERAMDIRFSDDTYIFMNPIIQKSERITFAREIDRVDGKEYLVPRFGYIELIFQDCIGSVRSCKLEGVAALVVHQALDLLDGVFSSDLGLEILPEFDQATDEERIELIKEFFKTLDERYNALDNNLQKEDEAARDQWNAIKYMIAKDEGLIDTDKEEEKPLSNRKKKFFSNMSKKFKHNENRLKFWRKK